MDIKNKILSTLLLVLVLFSVTSKKVQAQNPAGLPSGYNLEFWLDGNDLYSLGDEADITSWTDKVSGVSFQQNGTNALPLTSFQGLNFNLSVSFPFDEDAIATINERRKLVSPDGAFTTSASKSYHIFWISSVEDQFIGRNTILSMDGTDDGFGWNNTASSPSPMMWTYKGTTHTAAATGKRFAISAATLPNDNGPGAFIYNNDIKRAGATRNLLRNGAAQWIIGNGTKTAAQPFYGNIQEILIYTNTSGIAISDGDMQKVISYFALKYGISLESDYKSSDGSVIFSQSFAGNYNKNIFGIGKDSGNDLNQKQSTSSESSYMTVFVGATKPVLNLENTSTLINDQFLIFGSNDANGDLIAYNYDKGENFGPNDEYQLSSDINFISSVKLKAQTNVSGGMTVNINTHIAAQYLLVSTSENFEPNLTHLYEVTDKVASNVHINNGDYVGFASFQFAPGGVFNGLRIWMKADDESTITLNGNGEVTKWVDAASGTIYQFLSSLSNTTRPPLYNTCNVDMNYHPAVNFRAQGEYLSTYQAPFSKASPDAYTFFNVMNNNFGASNRSYPVGFGNIKVGGGSSRKPAFGVMSYADGIRGRFFEDGGAASVDGTLPLYKSGATTIMYHEISANDKATNYVKFEFDGRSELISGNDAKKVGQGTIMNKQGTLGTGSKAERNLIGVMGELFAYERVLTQTEKNAINSYLSLKYGITLNVNNANFDYFLSDNSRIVWQGNSPKNSKFHNYIGALVRDDAAFLNNKQSRSTNVGSMVYMAVGNTKGGCDPALSGFERNMQAIVWGNDNKEDFVSFKGNADICGEMEDRMRRMWLVESSTWENQTPGDPNTPEVFNPETVTIRVGAGSFPYAGAGYQVYLLIADSEDDLYAGVDGNPGTGAALNTYPGSKHLWKRAIPGSFVNGEHQFTVTLDQKYTYFTFGARMVGGACESCEFDGIKTLKFTKTNWAKGSQGPNTFNLGDGFNADVKVTYDSPAKRYSKSYPKASSLNSLREYRRGGYDQWMTTTITPNVASAASFQLFKIGYRGRKYDNIEISANCVDPKGNTVLMYPKLSYVSTNIKKRSYTITAVNKAVANRKTSSYTAPKGRMNVSFPYPVKEIFVKHKMTGYSGGSAAKRIGIGPIDFKCPQPLPPVSDAGFMFVKSAPSERLLCQDVTYTYTIYNTNCDSKKVLFTDQLDPDMTWVSESLSVDWDGALDGAEVNQYALGRDLIIKDLVVPGSGSLTVRVRALFSENATERSYKNQAKIDYVYIKDDVETDASQLSWDEFAPRPDDSTPTPTYTKGVDTGGPRPAILKTTKFSADKSCYSANGEINVTITIENPTGNPVINDAELNINFSEEFTLVGNITSSTLNIGSPDDDGEDPIPGSYYFHGFKIPTGSHTIKFKVKAPAKNNLPQLYVLNPATGQYEIAKDSKGRDVIAPLEVDFEIGADTEDECLDTALSNLNGSFEVDFCESKEWIISNKNATIRVKK